MKAARLSATALFLFFIAASLALVSLSCSNLTAASGATSKAAEGTCYSVSVSMGVPASKTAKGFSSSGLSDANVKSVAIVVYNSSGVNVGHGSLTNYSTYWAGGITVSQTGLLEFVGKAYDSNSLLLYVAKNSQTVADGDKVTLAAQAVSLRGGSVQGTSLGLSSSSTASVLAGAAGSQGAGDATDDGTGTAAKFYNPQAMTCDGTYLYVLDKNSSAVALRSVAISTGAVKTLASTDASCLTTDGTYLYLASSRTSSSSFPTCHVYRYTLSGSVDASLEAANDRSFTQMTVSNGTLYLYDGYNAKLVSLPSSFTSTSSFTVIDTGTTTLSGAAAMTTDGSSLFIDDIEKFSFVSVPITSPTSATSVDYSSASPMIYYGSGGMVTDGTTFFLTDCGSSARIFTCTSSFSPSTLLTLSSGFTTLKAVATDGVHLFAVSADGYDILRIR